MRRSFRDDRGRLILTAWRDDGTVDLVFIGQDRYPHVHKGLSAETVKLTAILHGWREEASIQ